MAWGIGIIRIRIEYWGVKNGAFIDANPIHRPKTQVHNQYIINTYSTYKISVQSTAAIQSTGTTN
jgi:hypothetical protein